MIEFHGHSKGGELVLPLPQLELRKRFLATMEGKAVVETLRREGKSKSWSQVKTHFGLAVEMIRERMMDLGWDICGIAPNKDMIHDILTKACGGVGELGATVRLSEMTTTEAAAYFENIRAWAMTQLNLNIPDPDKNWKDKGERNES